LLTIQKTAAPGFGQRRQIQLLRACLEILLPDFQCFTSLPSQKNASITRYERTFLLRQSRNHEVAV
jgi:hypothetical protein